MFVMVSMDFSVCFFFGYVKLCFFIDIDIMVGCYIYYIWYINLVLIKDNCICVCELFDRFIRLCFDFFCWKK